MKWQPIESAPRDGTPVLVWRGPTDIFVAHYVSPVDVFGPDDSDDYVKRWWSTDGQDLTGPMPSHWTPLPEPPSDQGVTS